MSERTSVRYSDGVIIVSEADPTETLRIEYARRLVAAAMPSLEEDKMERRELRYTAIELARCVRELLVIVGDTRD